MTKDNAFGILCIDNKKWSDVDMKNVDVVKHYVAGAEKGKTKNVSITGHEGERLMNYFTCLAQRLVDEKGKVSYIINATKYSQSTTDIQNMLLTSIPSNMIDKTVIDIPMGTSKLN